LSRETESIIFTPKNNAHIFHQSWHM
jgi:hypothetical protein